MIIRQFLRTRFSQVDKKLFLDNFFAILEIEKNAEIIFFLVVVKIFCIVFNWKKNQLGGTLRMKKTNFNVWWLDAEKKSGFEVTTSRLRDRSVRQIEMQFYGSRKLLEVH